ncbi:MAG: transcription antitermination factor NusB [Myxococcota bacterium]
MSEPDKRKDRVARRVALWTLFAMDVTCSEPEPLMTDLFSTAMDLEEGAPEVWEHVESRVLGVFERLDLLNEEIQELSPRWRLGRMGTIDRNLLRLGAWEILQEFRRPVEVINDCVELAKEYGEKTTPGFVNGLLDQLCKNHGIRVG